MSLLTLAGSRVLAQDFSDDFADSQLLTGSTATVTGSNTNATLEPGEPQIAGKVGGHSVWISWIAPANGLVTLSTAGSSFDTLLGAYILEPEDGPPLESLQSVAANDDFGGLVTSQVQFGANSGQTYYISVDGFNGAVGDIMFQLNFASSVNLQPTLLSANGDRALRLGDPLILTVNFIPTSSHLDLQWYFNGNPVNDATYPTLVIPNLQTNNLGFYSLLFELSDDTFSSSAIEIQVDSEGQQNVLARNKIADAAQSGLTPSSIPGVTIGYNGTQIYNTTNAVVDPTAPLICGVPPGAAYWFSYTAPTNGVMSVDTGGSEIPTLLASFTYSGALVSYTNLVSLACDNNASTGTNTDSNIQFAVTNGGHYFIVVGGVNGARGLVQLNYSLAAEPPPAAPVLTSQPQGLLVGAGTAVALSTVASGSGTLSYSWWKDNALMRGKTNASILLDRPAVSDSGDYSVIVTNASGSVTSAPAVVTVISAPLAALNPASNYLVSAFPATRGYQYQADCAAALTPGSWLNFNRLFPDYGGILWLTNSTLSNNCLFVRVHAP
ncbi:MAG TPA: hypothetical protein VNX46_10425 [Candidatus Acidoferrum sp.]|nr:hypothetical protein [Candidatus Acidoferrum sp.]